MRSLPPSLPFYSTVFFCLDSHNQWKMEATADNPSHTLAEDGIDPPADPAVSDHNISADADESLRESYNVLQSKASEMEESLLVCRQERDEALRINSSLRETIGELSRESDSFRLKLEELEVSHKLKEEEIAEVSTEKGDIARRLDDSRTRIEELESEREDTNEFLAKSLDQIRSARENLVKLIERLNDERVVIDENGEVKDEGEARELSREIAEVLKLAIEADSKLEKYKEAREKEKKELENSLVSLTEENRDINSLLRVALVEKETVEKNLNRLKGNTEQKRVPLLQLGLQRVGFGFMMGSGLNEQTTMESSAGSTASGSKSDGSESEEEVVSLASTVEKIMKNLRLEISQLRRSLEESRSDAERLQSLTQQQAQKIEENKLYIRELEDRERILAQNVEELLVEIKETENDVARWREACELEVEAGNKEVEERDRMVSILTQELEKTKAALDISNGKLKLKEDLAAAAVAAQTAAERSLQLADSRNVVLNQRIEELTKQLDEAEKRERSRRKVRHICWPWRLIKTNMANNTSAGDPRVKRMLPEMQALLHYTI